MADYPTLLDLSKAGLGDVKIDMIVELLMQENEILQDMTWKEGNLVTGEISSIRTGLPEPTWRSLYGFVQPTKNTYATIEDKTAMLEAYSEVDKALADLNGNRRSVPHAGGQGPP